MLFAKIQKNRGLFILLGIAILYGLTRLFNLTFLPIFTDEAIYIRWSQIGARDASWRFISLVDGKQPMFTWMMMVLFRVMPTVDPLFVGRLTSVLAGLASCIGIWFLAREVFKNHSVAWMASLVYILLPFTLLYDRMALYDSMVAMFSVWNLYLALLLVRTLRLDITLILGMALGAGMLNKTSGFLTLYMLPLTLVLLDWQRRDRVARLLRWTGLAVLAAILSQIFYSILRLSPFFHMVAQKDAVFVYPLKEWLEFTFRFLYGNLRGEFDWVWRYMTIPLFFAAMAPIFSLWTKPREKLLLYAWWLAPFIALALFGRVLYPRFVLFMTMPLVLLTAWSLEQIIRRIKRRAIAVLVVTLVCLPALYTDYFVILDPIRAPIPLSDRGQYIDDWPSGWGIREVNQFLLKQSQQTRVTVFTDGTFGLLPYAIEIYLVDKPNIEIRGVWPLPKEIPQEVVKSAQDHATYLVLNQEQIAPLAWPLVLISEYQKGSRTDRTLRLYQVISSVAALRPSP